MTIWPTRVRRLYYEAGPIPKVPPKEKGRIWNKKFFFDPQFLRDRIEIHAD